MNDAQTPTETPPPIDTFFSFLRTTLIVASMLAVALWGVACGAEATDETTTDAAAAAVEESAEPEPTAAPEPTTEPTVEPTAAPAPTEVPTAEPAPAADPVFELQGDISLDTADVNSLVAYVEEQTGRPFVRPPVIIAQDLAEFEAGLAPQLDELAEFDETVDTTVRYLQAMGLTDMGVADYRDTFVEVMTSADGIAGYYDDETDAVYIPNAPTASGDAGTDEFRALLVHELVHALDAQYVDFVALIEEIDRMNEAGALEEVLGLAAVVEGRATSVQTRWMQENNAFPEALELGAAEALPPATLMQISMPYSGGWEFVEYNGGPAETWDLFENPPTSTEHLLFPDTPVEEPIVEVPIPAADGPIIDSSVYGAADLFVAMLGESLEPAPAVIYPTIAALDGWAGGSAVLWGDDAESCVRFTIAADTPEDLSEFGTMFARWTADADNRDATIVDSLITVTTCAPYAA